MSEGDPQTPNAAGAKGPTAPGEEDEDRQELRLAVVMTGGVSLAVWMGGVTHEINRLLRGDHAAYGEVLDLTLSRAQVDVISGTSAGGLNGALLATAIAYDSDLEDLRRVWLEEGDLDKLLRDPLEVDPPSLLRGDAVFLPEIETALKALRAHGRSRNETTSPTERPVEFVATVSLLEGRERGLADDFGTVLRDRDHRAELSFSRGGLGLQKEEDEIHDDFASTERLERLAYAARASASFPVAFEPRFLRVEHGDDRPDNMRDPANFPESRWGVDGGVLVNKPLAPALRAVLRRSVREQVRRVLLYIVPDPGEELQVSEDQDRPPSAREVLLDSLTALPRNESIVDDLNELEAHNERARHRRRQRALLPTLGLQAAASRLTEAYQRVRAERAADRLLFEVATALPVGQRDAGGGEAGLWERDVLRRALVRCVAEGAARLPPPDGPPEGAFSEPAAAEREAPSSICFGGASCSPRQTRPTPIGARFATVGRS